MEPRECLRLWQSMSKLSGGALLDGKLDPASALPEIVKKSDVVKWETALREQLIAWMSSDPKLFSQIQQELAVGAPESEISSLEIIPSSFSLLVDLHSRGALPAIVFNYDRQGCEAILSYVLDTLKVAEKEFREPNP